MHMAVFYEMEISKNIYLVLVQQYSFLCVLEIICDLDWTSVYVKKVT